MTIRTIALALFEKSECAWLTPLACEMARIFDAHLNGIHPLRPIPVYFDSDGNITYMQALRDIRSDETREIEKTFEDAARRTDIRGEFRSQPDTIHAEEAFLLSAIRGADVIVTAPVAKSGDATTNSVKRTLIRSAGRPVLLLPEKAAMSAAPDRILVGWSDTREATRAAHDVLTLAAPGASIDLLSMDDEDGFLDSREDFAVALDRLGYRATLVDRRAPARERGETLLEVAQERDAQIVATGAFGHSQVYDFVIGAVTNYLLENVRLPVLLSK
ncbi:universal stress protein [Aliiruegeria lutimaris]|uniref:Universal stress protein family protein n=1 Tax=Aliiruegeria lutimaris TaxID=571298 RepID=A0A1G8QTJ4_9RHOB|nr:universal stress protein [Aliiruegeria lutimaris]SDJ07490.1 Universal stress protein family protein [Aliiruegeria lutimaris]